MDTKIASIQKLVDLSGKVAIVTGAGQGIGEAISLHLAEAGASVAMVDKVGQSVQDLQSRIKVNNLKSIAIEANVASPDDVQNMLNCTMEAFNGIDILVNNAGIRFIKTVSELTLEDWNETLQTNLTGAFLCAKAVIPKMISQGCGKIINISSCGGLVGIPDRSAYCASKSGIIGLTKSLAAEVGRFGICVNAIAPGVIETSLTRNYFRDADVVDRLRNVTPQRKWGQPEDISFAAVFLASDASNFITGTVLSVDGGFTAAKEF